MVVSVFNIMKNGNAAPLHFTKSTITDDRLVVVRDDKNKCIWIFKGKHVNHETLRLSTAAIEGINTNNYDLKDVSIGEWNTKSDYLFHLSRDPEYTEPDKTETPPTKVEETPITEPVIEEKQTQVVEKAQVIEKPTVPIRPIGNVTNHGKLGLAPTPPSRGAMKAAETSSYVEGKTTPDQVIVERDKSRKELTQPTKRKPSPIPSPPETLPTPVELDHVFVPIGESMTGPIIEEFQISYYEKSGGANFLLVEELSKKINKSHEFTQIRNMITAINDLANRDASQLTASKVLSKQLDILIKTLYRN